MQLANKKALAAKVLKVGKYRIIFMEESLNEIKEAITRQDISDLYKSGAIKIREIRGRRKAVKRKHRRGVGKVKKKVKNSKQEYVKLTRKLRTYAKFLVKTKKINPEKYRKIRKMIKAKRFKSKRHLNEGLGEIQ
ncbi:MAG: 50S ribosomal protein L19e [Nanoarchaeota archaeon]|nr:50S ribosomal protein L19e [Nanoarchaeota archaeon]